jgi:hypothetical protein
VDEGSVVIEGSLPGPDQSPGMAEQFGGLQIHNKPKYIESLS